MAASGGKQLTKENSSSEREDKGEQKKESFNDHFKTAQNFSFLSFI
jgi:hypothetical protein